MLDRTVVQSQIINLIADKLDIQVPSIDTDLFDDGSLDSLTYVQLVVELQQEFEMRISLGQIDIDRFRTVEQIADFLLHHEAALIA